MPKANLLTNQFKIRLLLLLLSLTFAATALTINLTFDKEEVLVFDAQKIESRLRAKEAFVKNFLSTPGVIDSLRNVENDDVAARSLINEFRDKKEIYIQTYKNGRLAFWSSIHIVEELDSNFREGSSFTKWKNGWYETIKVTRNNFSVVCHIPVKADYNFENKYLKNNFSEDLIRQNNLEIANITDDQVYNIRNIDGKYLFSVKLKSSITNTFYSKIELVMWVLALICMLIFVNHVCAWLAKQGHLVIAIVLLVTAFATIRLTDLQFNLFNKYFDLELFNPKYYASNFFYPSIGDFLLNCIFCSWILTFIYNYRYKINLDGTKIGKPLSYSIFILCGLVISIVAYHVNDTFYGFVTNSNIDFNITNILNLSWTSWVGIIILCFTVLNIFLLIEIALAITGMLNLNTTERITLFLGGFAIIFLNTLLFSDFNIYFVLFAIIIFLRGWVIYTPRSSESGVFIFTVLLFAVISSFKLSEFQHIKEREQRKIIAQKLESADDPNAVLLFLNLEKQILKDRVIIDYFLNPSYNHRTLSNQLQKIYFDGYLSRYDFKTYEYNALNGTLKGEEDQPLSFYRDLVLSGSIKVSDYFYRKNNTFGFQNYFGLLPIISEGDNIGTLVVELKSKRLDASSSSPELVFDGKIKEDQTINEYSFAFYNDNKLLNQHGDYVYDLINKELDVTVKDFRFITRRDQASGEIFSHLIYRPNARKLIVVSNQVNTALMQLAGVSFLFLIFLFFTFLIICGQWIWHNLATYSFHPKNFKWGFLLASNRVLYKTRIQVSLVSAVVVTLLITGGITFYNISSQYRRQQEKDVMDKVKKIAEGFDKQFFSGSRLYSDEEAESTFNTFADVNATDLNLFDIKGNLILTTQPKIYKTLIADKMNALSFVYLSKLQKSEYINAEKIGKLDFITAYAPIRDDRNELIAYLGLPSFENEKEYNEKINLFLNALINIYALVFVAIGFFAVFLANQITSPLTLIQNSLSKIKIGSKNEPLEWTRNDEIGNLIREYNNMIAALEVSAQRLARSERETAWREMAKQIAHEIKNPLTPLKLGVQLLEKAWKEKDPKFDVKFDRFSKSFVEQIESLAHIASEFSNFAKMPDTILKEVNLIDVIEHAAELYNQLDDIHLTLKNQSGKELIVMADRDQLVRSFNNLLKNATEAIPEGKHGEISISVRNSATEVFVEIRDNGMGIPDSVLSRIFVPNFTTKSSGTGLGLAFVKQAIENMNGTIGFETSPESGTVFFLTIPVAS